MKEKMKDGTKKRRRKVTVRIPVKKLKEVLCIVQDPDCENDYVVFVDVEQIPKEEFRKELLRMR